MRVGPWHVKAHILACQLQFGARMLLGSGRSFGDNVEHLWAFLRPYAYILKRMGLPAREDCINQLVRAAILALRGGAQGLQSPICYCVRLSILTALIPALVCFGMQVWFRERSMDERLPQMLLTFARRARQARGVLFCS